MSSLRVAYRLCAVAESQRAQWDRFIVDAGGQLWQSWAWGELKAPAGWQPLRMALWEGERIVAAAQVLRRTAPRLPLRLGHLAYIPRGPVLDWSQPELCDVFLTQLTTYLRRQGALALRMELPQDAADAESELIRPYLTRFAMQPVHPIQPLRTIVLDLVPDEQTLLANMKEKWRYNVRLAARKGVTIRTAESLADVNAWYEMYRITSERDQFGIHERNYYERAWELLAPRGELRLLLAEHEGQLLAGIFVSLFARQATYLYGASSNEQRQLMPNYALQWEAIRWSRQQGAQLYDFWGIPDTDESEEAMAGVYRFKSGWGGRIVQWLGCYEQVYRPLPMSIARKWL